MNLENFDLAALDRDLQEFARQQRERGWWKRNWRWFVPVSLLAIVVFGGGAIYWALFLRVYNLEVCQSAMRTICADKQLQEALGQPIHTVKWPSRSAAPGARVEEREIDVLWNIEGPKSHAKAHANARLMMGKWEIGILEVTLADGKKVSLSEAGDESNEAPSFDQGPKKPEGKKSEGNTPAPEINLPIPPGETPGKS